MKDDKNKRYSITNLTSEQLFIIISAVENISRLNAGQVERVFDDINWTTSRVIDIGRGGNQDRQAFFDDIKKEIFPELGMGASYGVGVADEDDKLGILRQKQYEVYRQLRYLYNQENGEEKDGYSVYNYPSLHYSDNELVGLEVKEVKSNKKNKK